MSFMAKVLNLSLKLSGMKKKYLLSEKEFLEEVEKWNKSRGFYMPNNKKAVYKEHMVLGRPVLQIQKSEQISERAILYFFGGGMVIGPDKGDIEVAADLVNKTGCDIWFPWYPLCTEHCITESYDMVYECYRQMICLYGAGNVSTCGFSSGGALALGIAAHNNMQKEKLPMPRHIVAVSPGEVPWNDAERKIMEQNNPKDVEVDYAFMDKAEKLYLHGCPSVPDYMIHISRADFTGAPDIHFYWSEDEILYAAKQNFIDTCEKCGVKYTIKSRPGMIHCYPMLPYSREAKEDFEEIAAYLAL